MTNPDLQFDTFILPKDCLDLEVDADRADERWRERVISIAEQERGFADTAVANDQQLEHVVKALVGRISTILAIVHCRWRHGPPPSLSALQM